MRLSQPMTQGGQTFLHRFRMLAQIIRLAAFCSTMTTLLTFGFLCFRQFSAVHIERYMFAQQVRFLQWLWGAPTKFKGQRVSYWVYDTQRFVHWIHHKLVVYLILSIAIGLATGLILFFVWRKQGIKAHAKQTLSGLSIKGKRAVIKMIHKQKKASAITLMDLPLIKGTETQHMLITGTTGSGKTNAFKHLLNQIRDKKAVILDTTGEFVEKYYHADTDIIMNPFDNRCPGWDLWGECQASYHYDELAESLVPQSGHDPFWAQSARTLLAEILKKLHEETDPDIKKIIEYSNVISLEKLHEKLIDTKAAALIDPQSEKTATSIRMNLATHSACLEHLKGFYPNPVSIRHWIQDDHQEGWLFLAMTPAQRATLRPLLSCWLSIAIKSLMERPPSQTRRIWFMIDELPSLHALTDLSLCLSEGRKYGACIVLGVQNIPQLEHIYGSHMTQSLVDLCSTKVLFRCASFTMAQKIAHLIGTQERLEVQEGISYGAHDMRDGVSLNMHTKEKLVIPPQDLMALKDLSAYIQLPHGYPITQIDWKIAL